VQHYFTSPSTVTFQAILQPNTGSSVAGIVFNYVDLDSGDANRDGASTTVGVAAFWMTCAAIWTSEECLMHGGLPPTPDDRLDAVQPLVDRMLDDGSLDMLTGAAGTDLFVLSGLDRIIDASRDDLTIRL
jgi:hypothetical protein